MNGFPSSTTAYMHISWDCVLGKVLVVCVLQEGRQIRFEVGMLSNGDYNNIDLHPKKWMVIHVNM